MSRYIITVNNAQHVVDVVKTGPDQYSVAVDGAALAAPVAVATHPVAAPAPVAATAAVAAPKAAAPAAPAAAAPVGSAQMKAPMPGVIDSVLVEVGQVIAKGDTVIVLEAMKMKNDLRAEVAGQITAVHVSPGQQVRRGDLLATIRVTP